MAEQRSSDSRGTGEQQPARSIPPDPFISPWILEAHEIYDRELPQLLQERPGQWVAYHGAERIGFAPTKPEMYQVCRERGLDFAETLVACIEPPMGEILFGPGPIWDIFFGPSLNPPDAFVSPLILEAHEVYDRELPQLLEERPGQWVAYHGAERIGFAATKQEMYQVCRKRGFDFAETLVACIEPPMGDIIFGPGAIGDFLGLEG